MKDYTKHCIANGIVTMFAVISIVMISTSVKDENTIKPPKIERGTAIRDEIVTGVCNFGGCPVAATAETTTLPKTEEVIKEPLTTAYNLEAVEEVVVAKNEAVEITGELTAVIEETSQTDETTYPTEPAADHSGYIGTFYITGYTAEEGFPEGSATASGYGVRPGYCAMNDSQRRSLGISYGDQIYVDGLGTYTVMDCGCGWGVVDIWVYTNAEAYAMTGYYDVYFA